MLESAERTLLRFEKKVDEMKPSKSEINQIIMDYLVSEGYPSAAEKFALETSIRSPVDVESIRERVCVRSAIHSGQLAEAIALINDIDPELQLIEIIRGILAKSGAQPQSSEFLPAISFATEQLAPRAPTDPKYQRALECTMALMIFPEDKMPNEFKELLDVQLRERVATDVNKAILERRGERSEAKIRRLVRARAWAEAQAREVTVDVRLPAVVSVGLDDKPTTHALYADDDTVMA